MLIFVEMEYKHKLKKYNLSVSELANIFGAKNEISFRNSTAFKRYIKATVSIIEKVESEIVNKLS